MSEATTGSGRYLCISCRKRWTEKLQCDECLSSPRKDTPRIGATPLERTHSDDPRDAGVLEENVAAICDPILELHGWKLYHTGVNEAGKVYQTPGFPDRICLHAERCLVVAIEYKRPDGGVQSEAQRIFQALWTAAGLAYVLASKREHVETLHRTLTPVDTLAMKLTL